MVYGVRRSSRRGEKVVVGGKRFTNKMSVQSSPPLEISTSLLRDAVKDVINKVFASIVLQLKQELQVLGSQPAHGLVVVSQRRRREVLLLPLQLDDPRFDRVLDDETRRYHGSVLPDAMDTVDGLHLHRGIPTNSRLVTVRGKGGGGDEPPGIEDEHTRGLGEVESDSSGFEGDEEDGHFGVVHEELDGVVPRSGGHRPLKADDVESPELETAGDEITGKGGR